MAERQELTRRRWDCVVVGGGHNGLAAAAYLAKGGMGRISEALGELAGEAGAVVITGAAVGAILPGEGVRLAGARPVPGRP